MEQCNWYSPHYFNCSLLSCFGNKDERLTVGGTGYGGGVFQFRSIRLIKQKKNFLWFIKAASLLNMVINGETILNWKESDFIKSSVWYFKHICCVLNSLKTLILFEFVFLNNCPFCV